MRTRLALDTNILVRLVLDDHPRLSSAAAALVSGNACVVSVTALAEMGFVLLSFYEVTRAELTACVQKLMALPQIELENESRIAQALQAFEGGMDWFDALLWTTTPVKCTLATFDKQFARRAKKLAWTPKVELHLPSPVGRTP